MKVKGTEARVMGGGEGEGTSQHCQLLCVGLLREVMLSDVALRRSRNPRQFFHENGVTFI